MYSAPVSLIKNIPELTKDLDTGKNLGLIFNLECIDSSHRSKTGPNLNSIQRHIHWIADLPDIYQAVISDGPLDELETLFDSHRIILAPNNGAEIYSANFTWILPDLNLIRQELTELFLAVRDSLGSDLRPEYLSFSQSELWLKASAGNEVVRDVLITQFRHQNPSRLRLSVLNQQITVAPRNPWDRGQAVGKILNLLPNPGHQTPIIIYFGLEEKDEPAFRFVNKLGFSVIIHNRLPRTTQAHFFLRNSAELSKFLFWIHSR